MTSNSAFCFSLFCRIICHHSAIESILYDLFNKSKAAKVNEGEEGDWLCIPITSLRQVAKEYEAESLIFAQTTLGLDRRGHTRHVTAWSKERPMGTEISREV